VRNCSVVLFAYLCDKHGPTPPPREGVLLRQFHLGGVLDGRLLSLLQVLQPIPLVDVTAQGAGYACLGNIVSYCIFTFTDCTAQRERERRVHNVSSVHIIPRDDENMRQSLVERKKFNFHCGFHHVNGSFHTTILTVGSGPYTTVQTIVKIITTNLSSCHKT